MATLNFTKDPVQVIDAAHLAAVIDATMEWTGTVVAVGIQPDLVIVTNDVLEETDILRTTVQGIIDGYVFDPSFEVIDGIPSVARPQADVIADVAALSAADRDALINTVCADYLARKEVSGAPVPITTRAPVIASGGGPITPSVIV